MLSAGPCNCWNMLNVDRTCKCCAQHVEHFPRCLKTLHWTDTYLSTWATTRPPRGATPAARTVPFFCFCGGCGTGGAGDAAPDKKKAGIVLFFDFGGASTAPMTTCRHTQQGTPASLTGAQTIAASPPPSCCPSLPGPPGAPPPLHSLWQAMSRAARLVLGGPRHASRGHAGWVGCEVLTSCLGG